MKHEHIILALIRCAVASKSEATIHQVHRLRNEYQKEGDTATANKIADLLRPATEEEYFKIVQSII